MANSHSHLIQGGCFIPGAKHPEGRWCLRVSHALGRGVGLYPPGRMLSPLCLPLESVGRGMMVPPALTAHEVPFERGGDISGCGGGQRCGMHMGKLRHRAVQGVTSWSRDPGWSPPPPAMHSGPQLPSSPLDAAAALGPDASGHHVGSTVRALGWVRGRCGVPITTSGGI